MIHYFNQVIIRRGEPFLNIKLVSGENAHLYYYFPNCRFSYGDASPVIDGDLQPSSQTVDRSLENFIIKMSNTQPIQISEFRSRNFDSLYSAATWGSVRNVQIGETIQIGALNFSKYANLFKEAEG